MTEHPVEKLVSKMAIPNIVSMLITSFYSMTDTFFVARIDPDAAIANSATAAVGIAFALMTFIQAMGYLYGQGSGIYMSRKLGEGDHETASKMASVSFFTGFGVCSVLASVCLIFLTPITRALGATETIQPYAEDYLRVILIGSPFMMSSLILNVQLRLQGNAIFSMIGIMAGAVVNIGLVPLFIFGFRMGMTGAGIGTIISQFVSFCMLLYGCTRGGSVRIRLRNFSKGWFWHKEIFRLGMPSLARQGGMSLATALINGQAKLYGDAAVAAISIVNRFLSFTNSIAFGIGQGFQPVCGFNYGAGRYNRVLKAFWFAVKVSFVYLLFVAVMSLAFAPQIVGIFRNDIDVISVGARYLRFSCIPLPVYCWTIIVSMLTQNLGKALISSMISMARHITFLVPAVFTLPYFLGMTGLLFVQPFADAGSVVLAAILGRRVFMELKALAAEETARGSTPPENAMAALRQRGNLETLE